MLSAGCRSGPLAARAVHRPGQPDLGLEAADGIFEADFHGVDQVLASFRPDSGLGSGSASAKNVLKKIAERGSPEIREIEPFESGTARTPLGASRRDIPGKAKLVVLIFLLRIAEDGVGFLDLLEFGFR